MGEICGKLSKVVGEDNIKCFEVIYKPSTSNNIVNIQEGLERRKVIQATA